MLWTVCEEPHARWIKQVGAEMGQWETRGVRTEPETASQAVLSLLLLPPLWSASQQTHVKRNWAGRVCPVRFYRMFMLAAADWLSIGKSVVFRIFFFLNFTLPLKHRSAFSSFCILVTKEMNVIRNADLHSKWSGTVWAFYVFGSSSTSCFLEHRI